MNPAFTIGIPVYNGMPFLPDTMGSVLRQTYGDFEILVIDDGSTDDTCDYLKSLRDPRLRVISQQNHGLTATLNRILEETRTPWLVRLDADDTASPERLARISAYANRWPNAGMFYSRAKHHHHAKVISLARTSEGSPTELRTQTQDGYLLAICHSTVVLNVRKAMDLDGYRFNLHIEDLDLWWRMALAHDIVFIPEILVTYRLNGESICSGNLRELSGNTLYAQYLLLSHLWNLPPRSFGEIKSTLQSFVDPRRLRYREHMWKAAICIGAGQYRGAAKHLLKAAVNAPGRFLHRTSYPVRKNASIRVGESPALFSKASAQLWPVEMPEPFAAPSLHF